MKPTQDESLLERQKGDQTDKAVILKSEPILLFKETIERKKQGERVDPEALEEACFTVEDYGKVRSDAHVPSASPKSTVLDVGPVASREHFNEEGKCEVGSSEQLESVEPKVLISEVDGQDHNAIIRESSDVAGMQEATKEPNVESSSPSQEEVPSDTHVGNEIEHLEVGEANSVAEPRSPTVSADSSLPTDLPDDKVSEIVCDEATKEHNANPRSVEVSKPSNVDDVDVKELRLSSASNVSNSADAVVELEKVKVKREMKMMEAALQRAAQQAQAKADEISKLMTEND